MLTIIIPDTFSPFLIQFWIGQDCVHNSCSMSWRIADHCPDDEGHLTLDIVHVATVGRHDGQVACSLVVKSKVLAERLGAKQFESFRDKEPDCPGVRVETSGGESLVGAVKEGKQLVLATNLGNLMPLVLGRIHSCGVVCACVEDDDRLGRGCSKILQPSIKVKTLVCLVPVSVGPDVLVARVVEDQFMVSPGWSRNINSVSSHNPLQKLGSIPQGSSSTQTLQHGHNIETM